MERDLIIKALECCTSEYSKCIDCPRYGFFPCTKPLLTDAISLIKELTNEKFDIECSYKALKKDNERLYETCTEFERKCASLNEENERLREQFHEAKTEWGLAVEHYLELENKLSALQVEHYQAKADTVRKMKERITEHATNGYPRKVRLDVIDQIAKEMLEEKNDS